MENSIKPSYEQGERGSSAVLMSISLGFSLFWMLFFTALLYDPFATIGLADNVLALPLSIAMCIGFAATDILVFKMSDFFSGERGHKVLWAVVSCYAIIPAIVLFTQTIYGTVLLHRLACHRHRAGVPAGALVGAARELREGVRLEGHRVLGLHRRAAVLRHEQPALPGGYLLFVHRLAP